MANHPGHDDDPPTGRSQGKSEGRAAAATEAGRCPAPGATEGWPGMARSLRGPHDLRDETLRLASSATSIANAARPDPQIVVAPPQRPFTFAFIRAMALAPLKSLVFVARAPAR